MNFILYENRKYNYNHSDNISKFKYHFHVYLIRGNKTFIYTTHFIFHNILYMFEQIQHNCSISWMGIQSYTFCMKLSLHVKHSNELKYAWPNLSCEPSGLLKNHHHHHHHRDRLSSPFCLPPSDWIGFWGRRRWG